MTDVPPATGVGAKPCDIFSGMYPDQLCQSSWRARPVSFTALMTLYESNYLRLSWLVESLHLQSGTLVSRAEGDCELELTVVEQSAYTTCFRLSYLFPSSDGVARVPELEVRVYHDARLAEARCSVLEPAQQVLRALCIVVPARLEPRWTANMLLNKWLEYCADRGHRFAAPAAAG